MTSPFPAIVADSNVVSYIGRESPIAQYYLERFAGFEIAISFQTVEEVWFGAYLNNWGERRMADLQRQLEQYRIIWPDPDLVRICSLLRSQRRIAGRELQVADAWIAATALYLGCPLASHDGDFDGIPDLHLIRAPTL